MTSRDFVFWLQGYIEISGLENRSFGFTTAQTDCIRQHLVLVFKHEIDPSMPSSELDAIHTPCVAPDPGGGVPRPPVRLPGGALIRC